MKKVSPDSRLSLLFKMQLEDGTEVESNFNEDPIEFHMGDGSLTFGMEDALMDKAPGDHICVTLSPELAFGYPDENNIHMMPMSDFPVDMPPEVNQVIAFDGPDDTEIMGTIINIKGDEVEIDFSHPLAGRVIKFSAQIIDIF
ncbi:MAG TPA: peptidylprolyl isomerase [Gammaproteobacteria bacterium]|nr:peptidylprolyl isomerase [Gammaproteobacteria bacterium]